MPADAFPPDNFDESDSACTDAPKPRAQLSDSLGCVKERFQKVLGNRRTPSTLVSLILHSLIILFLALVGVPTGLSTKGDAPGVLSMRQSDDSQVMDAELQLAADSASAPPQPEVPEAVSNLPSTSTSLESLPQLQRVVTQELNAPVAIEPMPSPELERLQSMNHQNLVAKFSDTGVEGRRSRNRAELAIQRGGSLESEKAVEAALEWLAAHQQPDGRWSLQHHLGSCNGRCSNPGSPDRFDPAATGLSLLAFLGAGYTHLEGKYQQNVRRGIYYLRQIAEQTPKGYSFLHLSDRGMYNQGIVAFALCEAYQLTQDPDLKELCQKTIDFGVYSQSYQGGWGYLPKQPGDLTISGWQMMSLKSARAAELDVSPTPLFKASHFLKSQLAEDKVNYFYRVPEDRSITCTAIGILLRMFLGESWTHPNIVSGLRLVANHNDYGKDIYFRYYATLVLFHAGGPLWEEWNNRCRDYLISTQSQEGHESGSWYFEDHFGKEGGRLYTTAMAAMTLQVYYRFSPLYQQTERSFEL